MQESIKINDITQTKTKDGKEFGLCATDKGTYSVWDGEVFSELLKQKGKIVIADYTVDKSGKYKTIRGFVAPSSEETFSHGLEDTARDYQSAKDLLIIRQVAAKCATEYLSATSATNGIVGMDEFELVAQRIYSWIMKH